MVSGMKPILIILLACALSLGIYSINHIPVIEDPMVRKPVIYIYPEKTMKTEVSLDFEGEIIHSYPSMLNSGWKVLANPVGEIEYQGRTYNYLFWEGKSKKPWKIEKGFVVPGQESIAFLQAKLQILGLNNKEANEFIVYWYPELSKNKYNLIYFAGEEYSSRAQLNIKPKPDCLIRVFMLYKPLNKKIEIAEQVLQTPERQGFVVVEWGGVKLD